MERGIDSALKRLSLQEEIPVLEKGGGQLSLRRSPSLERGANVCPTGEQFSRTKLCPADDTDAVGVIDNVDSDFKLYMLYI